jgi:hypothetical protein
VGARASLVVVVYPVAQHPRGVAAERLRVVPALTEDGLDVGHRGPGDGELDVVPGGHSPYTLAMG